MLAAFRSRQTASVIAKTSPAQAAFPTLARRQAVMTIERIDKTDLLQLARWQTTEAEALPDSFALIGNQQLLTTTKTAVLCSRQCPGEVILRLFELARHLRASDLTFIGGFHTPAERDFLHHLLPGNCRLIICPARSLAGMRVPAAWQKAIEAERMLLLSPFQARSTSRQSARLAAQRNKFILALAEKILLLHASPASRTEHLVNHAALGSIPVVSLEIDDETIRQRLSLSSSLVKD